MHKISVITPLYENDLVFIKDCASCLENQLFKDFEWIIITSLDQSIVKKSLPFTDSFFNIKIVNASPQKKLGEIRNIGIKNSTGDYLYFLDADDLIHEHTFYCFKEAIDLDCCDVVLGALKTIYSKPESSSTYNSLLNRLLENRVSKLTDAALKNYRNSCLGIFFLKSFIKKNKIKFDNNLILYSDFQFIANAYKKANRILFEKDSVYMKRVRNDSIRYPSFSKRYDDLVLIEYPTAYMSADSITKSDSELNNDFYEKFIKMYFNNCQEMLYDKKTKSSRNEVLNLWCSALESAESFKIKTSLFRKFEIATLRKGLPRLSQLLFSLKKTAKLLLSFKNRQVLKRKIYSSIFIKLKIENNWVLYESFLGKNISDSPKYIYQYLHNTYGDKYKHIWVLNTLRDDLPTSVIQVKRFSLKHLYYLSKAKFWVKNMRQPKWFIKKANQIFLETWHGTPLKKLVFDMDDVHSANKNYKQDFYDQSRSWDYLISANKYSTDIFKSAFLFDNPVLELGYPRNDLLHSPHKDEIALKLKQKLNIPVDKKIVLYAPTWRDDEFYKPGQYKFKLKLDLEKLRNELGNEYFLVLRTHYFIADHLQTDGFEDFVYNASKYDDITDLYLISDVLITDYSSVFFDYANLKRPILFFTYDLEKYRDTLRGFYLNMETDLPGPLVITNEDIINELKDYSLLKQKYDDKLKNFFDKFCSWDDGHAAKRIAEKVIIAHNRI